MNPIQLGQGGEVIVPSEAALGITALWTVIGISAFTVGAKVWNREKLQGADIALGLSSGYILYLFGRQWWRERTTDRVTVVENR